MSERELIPPFQPELLRALCADLGVLITHGRLSAFRVADPESMAYRASPGGAG